MKVHESGRDLTLDLYNLYNNLTRLTIMTKRSFFSVILIAAAMSGAVVLSSCSHDVPTYSEEEIMEANHAADVAKYEQAFVQTFGQPSPNQDWDFTKGGSFSSTRSASESNPLSQWPSYSAYLLGYNSKYATGNGDPLPQGELSSTVVKDADAIKAAIEAAAANGDSIKWHPNGNYVFRTVASYRNSTTNSDNDKYYSIGANFGNKNNFMALLGVKKNGKVSKNGAAGTQHTSAIVFNTVPSDATWFAVTTTRTDESFVAEEHPLEYYVEVTYNNRTFWGFRCDGYAGKYSDLILWVAPANIEKELIIAKRYMTEDLGGAIGTDFDFNDIVFDVLQYSDGSQKCIVRALGGTLPIKIKVGNSKWWSKPEPVDKMINTGAYGEVIETEKVIAEFDVTGWEESKNNVEVMVENKEGYEFVTTFPDKGRIPAMIAFSTNKAWNAEKVKVVDDSWFTTYPFEFDFSKYITE